MKTSSVLSRSSLFAAALLLGASPQAGAASFVWDGTTASYVLTSADDFSFTTFTTGADGLAVTARDLKLDQNLTFGGAFSFTQTGGGSLYQGINLANSTSITATAITLSGDIGKRDADGNTLTLNTSAANGAINLNVSLGRAGVWYVPSGLTANAGTGTITVSGTNGQGWRSTPVSLTGGAINITNAVSSNAAVTLTNSLASTISGVLSGSMNLIKAGAGVTTMTGRATYTGTTTVNAGTLQLNDARSMNKAITVNSGATLTVQSNANGGYYQPDALTVNGATVNAVSVGANLYHGIYTKVINFGTGTSTVSVPLFINKAGDANSHTLVITADTGALATINGVISGHPDTNTAANSAVTKNGAGTLILTGNSNFKGNFTINGGEVQLAPAAAPTSAATGAVATAAGDMSVAGRLITVNSGATLKLIQGDTFAGYNVKAATSIVLEGGTLWRQGKEAGSELPYFNSLGDVTLRDGAVIRTGTGVAQNVQALAFNGLVTVSGTTGSTIVATAATSLNGIHLGTVGNSTTFNIADTSTLNDLAVSVQLADKVLGEAATLIKTGAGRMLLSVANAYSGGTTLRAGTLVGSNGNAFGGSGTVTLNDASTDVENTALLIDATAGSVSIARAITVANQGSGTVTLGSATTANTNLATFSGAISLNKATTLSGGTNGDRLTFSGGISGTANVTIAGTNRVVFTSAANTYAGSTTINSGAILQLSDGSNVSTSFLADSQDVIVNGALRLAKGGNSEAIGGLSGSGSVSAIAGADTLTVGSGNATASYAGTLDNAGATLAFTKTGSGTQTLTGVNTYTGATTISQGTLALTGSGALGASAVSIASAATLSTAAGTTVGGAVTVNSGATLTANGTLSGAAIISGTATIGGSVAGLTTINNGATLTANGTLSAVTLNSGGTLRGSGSAGAITVAAGTANLIAGNGTSGTFSATSLDFSGAGTLTIGALANYTSSAAFAISGALNLSATNVTLALPAGFVSNGTYKLISYGTTAATIANFTVAGSVIGARQFADLTQNVAANTFEYTIAGDSPTWSGANSSAFNGGNNWVLINAGTATDFISNDALLVDDSSIGTVLDISGADVAPAVLTFENSTKNFTLQGSNGLSAGSLVKNGSGNLTVSNTNAIATATITNGSLILNNAGALGSAAVTLSGGALNLNGQTTAAAVVLAGGALTGTGTVNGVISGAGALTLTTSDTLTLTAQNTFTGGTSLSNGTLVLGHATNTLTDAGEVSISGGELSLGANSETVGTLNLTGGSITGAGTLTTSTLNLQAGTVAAVLAGSAVLTKTGGGTVTLSNANTFSGGTTLTQGTLTLGNAAALGAGSIALNGGSIDFTDLTLTNALVLGGGSLSGSGTYSGTLSGSSAFIKSGAGALTLAGAQNPTGGISVTGGTLTISGSLNAGAYAGTIASNGSGALALTGNSNQTLSGIISGAAGLSKSGNGTLTLSGGSSSLTGNIEIAAGKVTVTGFSGTSQGSNPTLSALGNMTTAGRTITVGSGATLEIVASDAFGAYNYLSPVTFIADGGTIAAGLASVGTSGAFRSIGNLTLRNGGALVTANGNAPIGELVGSFAINGNVTVDGASATGATISPEATQTFQNYINLGTNGSNSTTFTVAETNDAATADLTISTLLANKVLGGGAGLVKAGQGRMVLTAGNRYTGATTVSAGTLAIGSGGGIYRGGFVSTTLAIASGATLELQNWHYNESTASLGGLTAAATGMVVNGGTIRVTGTSSYGRGVTVNSGGVSLEAAAGANWTVDTVTDSNAWIYNGNPSITFGGAGTGTFQKVLGLGTGAVTKTGESTWTLSGANTYSGGTTIAGGKLIIGQLSSLGTGTVLVSGGILDLNNLAPTNIITLSGGSLLNASAWASTGVIELSGNVSADVLNALPGEVKIKAGTTVNLTGVTKDIVFEGGTLSNLSGYQGNLKVKGSLDLSAGAPAGEIEVATGGTVAFGNAASNRSLKFTGGTITGANFTGDIEIIGSNIALGSGIQAGRVRLTAGNSATIASGFERDITFAGGTLAGLTNYSGTVSLETGATLTVDDTTGASFSLASGSTLKGDGTIDSLTQAAGSILAPGNSPGLLTTTTFAPAGGAIMEVEFYDPSGFAGTGYDAVASSTLDLSSLDPANRYILKLISLSGLPATEGPLNGFDASQTYAFDVFTYATLILPASYSGGIADLFTIDLTRFQDGTGIFVTQGFTLSDTDSALVLNYAPIPEPSTYGLILGGLALAGAAVRRRRQAKTV